MQNEGFADQKFPSCKWSAPDLALFIREHLGPALERAGLTTKLFLGTLNGPLDSVVVGMNQNLQNYSRYVDEILFDDATRRYIAGVGYQWNGQYSIVRTRACWPELELVQTESECGFGENSWEHAEYVFHLIRHYLQHGATGYTYWNLALGANERSTWGWLQNSLFSVDRRSRTFVRNPEYYTLKHYSAFVRPGAVRLETEGRFAAQGSAYRNADGSVAVAVQNALTRAEDFTFSDSQRPELTFTARLEPRSLNTFLLPAPRHDGGGATA